MENLKLKSGVYKITNIINNKVYVGSSVNIIKRKSAHRCMLRDGTHSNEHLQSAYNKYGKDSFVFEVIEYSTKDNLINREQYWIDELMACNRLFGYNKSPVAESYFGSGLYKGKPRRVINIDTGIMFDSILDAANSCNMEVYINIIKVCKGERGTAGGFRWAYINNDKIETPSYEQKWSRRRVINVETQEVFETVKEAAEAYNVKSSNISRICKDGKGTVKGVRWAYADVLKHMDTNCGPKKRRAIVINLDTLEVYKSITEAGNTLEVDISSITKVCKKKSKTAGGYHWQYYEDYLKDQEREK